jgi:hypothetical protein
MNKLKKLIAIGTTASMLLSFVAVMPVQAVTIADGDLVKTADSSAVYYIQGSNKRVFPHYNVYLSWGYPEDFSTVKTVTASELAAYEDANPMPFRDGSLFRGTAASLGDKDATAVFYVEDAQLRPVLSEQVYQGLFSDPDWVRVTWVPDDLLSKFDYEMGSDITSSSTHPDGAIVKYEGESQKYLIQDGKKRAISEAAFEANRYKESMVITIESGETYANGSAITGVESGLLTPGWVGESVAAGALSASLVSVAGATLPGGATNVSLLSVRFTAGSSAATITGLTFKRSGIGAYNDWDALYVYEGDTRITASSRSLNSDTHEVEFPTVSISVPANSSKTVTLRGDLKAGPTAGGVHSFQLKAVETTASISGLPLTGSAFTNGAEDVSTVTVAAGAAPSNPSVGADAAEVATLKLTAGNQDIEFNQVVLTMTGSLSRGDISNIKLYQESTLLASAASVRSDDTVTLTLDSPYSITNGQNKTFSIKADLGGRVSETLTVKVEESGHVFATDKQYNYGAKISDGVGVYNAVTLNTLTLQGGSVTMTNNGPSVGSISKNVDDVTLLKFAMTSDRNLEVKKLEVRLCASAAIDASATDTISDLRVKDADTGSTLMSKSITSPTNWGEDGASNISKNCSDPTDYVLTDSFYLTANTTRNLKVTVDLGTAAALENKNIRAMVNVDSTDVQYSGTQVYMRDVNTGDYVNIADVVPGTLTGKDQTIEAASLTAAVSSTPVTGLTVVKGASDVEGVGVNLTAGKGSAMKVKQMQTRVYVSSGASKAKTFPAAGEDETPSGEIIKVSLWDGSTKLSEKTLTNTSATHNYGLATFDNFEVNIAAGATKKLVVKFDVSSESTAAFVAVGIPADGYSVYDSDDNSVDATGDINLVTVGNEPDRYVIVSTSGNITIAQDASTPDSDIVLAGSENVVMSKVKFSAVQEDWTVQELTIGLTGNEGTVEEVGIEYVSDSSTVTTTGQVSNNEASFTGMSWVIPKDSEKVLTIKATLADIDPNIATTGSSLVFGVACGTANNCKIVGESGETKGTDASLGNHNGNTMYLRKSRPTVAMAALPSSTLINGTNVINKFTVTADSAGEITLKKLSWDVNVSDADTAGTLSFDKWALYKDTSSTAITGVFSDGTTTSTQGTTGIAITNGNKTLVFEPTSEISVSAGTTATFTLKAEASNVVKDEASISTSLRNSNDTSSLTGGLSDHATQLVQIDDGSTQSQVDFLWSDRARGISHKDSYQSTYLDWTNGYLIDVLPTDSVSLSY